MISIHEKDDAAQCRSGWLSPFEADDRYWLKDQYETQDASLENIEWAVVCYTWSCSIFADGVRNSSNFRRAQFVALDFDEGRTLEWAVDTFRHYACVIATTKSHLEEKNGVVAERFRVVLKLSEIITDAAVFQRTVKSLIDRYGSDRACSDPARLYFRSRHAIYTGPETGELIVPAPPAPVRKLSSFKAGSTRLPYAIEKFQKGGGFALGQRNNLIYQAGRDYCRLLKYSYEQAYAAMRPLTDEDEAKFSATLKSAFKDSL